MKTLKRWISTVIHDDNLDLYLLAIMAFGFTVLGVSGVASVAAMSSITLATLAVLTLSQVRSRGHIAKIAAHRRIEPLALLSHALTPPDRLRYGLPVSSRPSA